MAEQGAKAKDKPSESKREKFVRLANQRTNRALSAVRLLGQLARPNEYEFTTEDVDKIVGAIAQALQSTKARFENPSAPKGSGFTL